MTDTLDDLIEKLESLSHEAFRAAKRKAFNAVGDFFIEKLSEAAPERAGTVEDDPAKLLPLQPGELKRSFGKRVNVPTDLRLITGDAEKEGEYVVVKPKYNAAYYVALWLEYGHLGPKKSKKCTLPHPFIRKTEDMNMENARDIFTAVLTDEIEEVLNAS